MITSKERFFILIALFISAILLNTLPFYTLKTDDLTIYLTVYSLTPYFVYGFLINNVYNRTIIYTTAAFMLILDYFIKFDIYKNLDNKIPGMMMEGFFIAPFMLVAFATISFILGLCFINLYRKFFISDKKPEIFNKFALFEDKELANFVLIVIIFGLLINMQNFTLSSSATLNALFPIFTNLNINLPEATMNFLGILLTIFPYFAFVVLSYRLNNKWISYFIGFMVLIVDIYIKIVTNILIIPDFAYNDTVITATYNIFRPFIFFMFIVVPISFSLIIFGKKILKK